MGVRGVWGVRGVRGVRGQRAALVLPRQPRLDPPVSALRVSFALTRQISRVRNALAWRVARMCLTLLSRCAAGAEVLVCALATLDRRIALGEQLMVGV